MKCLITKDSLVRSILTASVFITGIPGMAGLAAQTNGVAGPQAVSYDAFVITRWILLGLSAILLVILLAMARSVLAVARLKIQNFTGNPDSPARSLAKPLSLLGLMMISTSVSGQSGLAGAANSVPLDIYLLIAAILLELLIMLFLVRTLFQFVGIQKMKPAVERVKKPSLFQRLNQTVAIDREAELDLKHNYDGIRELDNKTPAWWTYAFYISILFGAIYLYRMFVSKSLPGQLIELAQENERAEILQSQYLKTAASAIDENNVTMLDPESVAKGAMTFKVNCAVCHGVNGEGNVVGPNLTDDYWIHKGSIKDIFYTIKYGVPEKGMKSWKDDFSPVQIAELASYVKSLHGTNPANAKEKQGELFVEESPAAAPDTTGGK